MMSSKSRIRGVPIYMKYFRNVRFRTIDISQFVQGTRVQRLYASGRITKSKFYLSHCSDMLRFLLVHKYGGIYFDQDVLSLKPIPDHLADANFLVEERDDILASAVFKMNQGHQVIDTVLKLMVRKA
jgi:hypothetical protein